ncbi:hypothetical protein KBC70_01665 [Candidatus Woesebacteria bacterium]|nr:hypothetical protein [Candidatus Woesebacteria bacterium]
MNRFKLVEMGLNRWIAKGKLVRLAMWITLIIVYVMMPSTVQAQQFSFSVSPPLVEMIIKPGKSVLVAYTVTNGGDPTIISANVLPFQPLGITGDVQLKKEMEGPIRFSLDNSNIQLGKPFMLQPRKGQQLLVSIRVPEGTPEGDYYYTFFIQNELGKPVEGASAAQTQGRVGAHILVTVTQSGRIDAGGSIGSLTVKPHYSFTLFGSKFAVFESTDVIPVDLVLQNTGRNYIKPEGVLNLKGTLGENTDFAILPQNILSQSSRRVSATPSAEISANERTEPASLILSGFFVGKYTIKADISFGPNTGSHTSVVTFYAFPFKLMLSAGLALIVGLIIIQQLKTKKQD